MNTCNDHNITSLLHFHFSLCKTSKAFSHYHYDDLNEKPVIFLIQL